MTGYARRLGLFSATMAVIGGIIGSGGADPEHVPVLKLGVASLFIYRAREAPVDGARFRVPAHPWTPALFVLAATYVVVSSVLANPRNALIGTGLLGLGIPVYRFASRPR